MLLIVLLIVLPIEAKIPDSGSSGHLSFSCLCPGFPHLPVCVLMKGEAWRPGVG